MATKKSRLLIDTDVFSYLFRKTKEEPDFAPLVQQRKAYISFVTIGEFYFGVYKAGWGARKIDNLKRELYRYVILYPDYTACLLYGDIKAECTAKGCPASDPDYWIAACALSFDIPLLTNNWKHFNNIPGIKIISPGHPH
jgi:tRNA(fMet)-specific endonuclease VapC